MPCKDCDLESEEPSPHLILLQICDLFVALAIAQDDLDTLQTWRNTITMKRLDISFGKTMDHNQRAMKEVSSVLESISFTGKTILENIYSENIIGKYVRLNVPYYSFR